VNNSFQFGDLVFFKVTGLLLALFGHTPITVFVVWSGLLLSVVYSKLMRLN